MSTVSQDNYVMEMQVQQEKWAKQKETNRDGKRVKNQTKQNKYPFVPW